MENQTIGTAGSRATSYGTSSMIIGIICALGAIGMIVLGVMVPSGTGLGSELMIAAKIACFGGAVWFGQLAAQNLVCAGFYRAAGKSLKQVVDTQGNDVALLMTALAALRKAFKVEAMTVIIVQVVFFILGIVLVAMIASAVGGVK
jgi:hypothetical protein